jgi:Domain of unknown function (DUF1842)
MPDSYNFMIGTGAPGAQRLTASLLVQENSRTVTGKGELTQAIAPPLHANNAFHGLKDQLVLGDSVMDTYSLQGAPSPPRLGAPHVTHLLIKVHKNLNKGGRATYTYVIGDKSHEVKDVPVTLTHHDVLDPV